MRLVSLLGAGLLYCASSFGPASAQSCPEPPPPGYPSYTMCANPFDVVAYSSLACPQPNTQAPDPEASLKLPIDGEPSLTLEKKGDGIASAKGHYVDWTCPGWAVRPSLECGYVGGNVMTCKAWPLEMQPSGRLAYETIVAGALGTERYYGTSMEFVCPEGDYVNAQLIVRNAGYPTYYDTRLDCVPPPPPGVVRGVSVGCPGGLPGYNKLTIVPPADGGMVSHYVVELQRVRYAGGWQEYYRGNSTTPLINPQAESYVRVKACNYGGCSDYVQSAQRANPSLYCP